MFVSKMKHSLRAHMRKGTIKIIKTQIVFVTCRMTRILRCNRKLILWSIVKPFVIACSIGR